MSFGWQTRLARNSEINRVFQAGKRHNGGVFLLIAAHRKSDDALINRPRMCVVVSKKVSRSAVQRNRIKRRFRSLFREQHSLIPCHLDLVVVVRASAKNTSFEELNQRFARVCTILANS